VVAEIVMSNQIVLQINLPGDLRQLRFPRALNRRLQQLLDKQDESGRLSISERQEAEGLVEMAEMISLLRLRAARSPRVKRGAR
jgi:hypothetical protein